MTDSLQKGGPGRAPMRPIRPRSRRRRLVWILIFVLILAGVAWIVLRPHEQAQPTGRRGSNTGAVPVVSATVQKGDIQVLLDGLGTVTSLATVTVRTQINGQLMELAFQEGQLVKKGDFLAQIDPRPYQVALEQAEGQLVHDQGLLKEAETDLARYQLLSRQDSIARQQFEDQVYVVKQYEGSVKSDQALIDSAKLNLAYCHIVSPVDGRVGIRQVDVGNYVQTSDANGIVVLTQLQPISVLFTLPEDSIPAVMKRLHSGPAPAVTIYDRAENNQLAVGTLVAVDTQINTSTGTVNLRAQFDNKDGSLFPNQFVNAELLVDTLHDVVVAPSSAIQRGAPGTFVYLIKPDNTVTVRVVKLGPTEGERVAVNSGLESGDKVVVDGADKLREGSKVTEPPPPAAALPAPGAPGGANAPSPSGTTPSNAEGTPPASTGTTGTAGHPHHKHNGAGNGNGNGNSNGTSGSTGP
jgi:multidrug efflux system membrane fusion protein